jgi:hypothetical protein
MKVFIFIFTLIVALLSVTFRDPLSTTIKLAFYRLPPFPFKEIYQTPKPENMLNPRAIRKVFLAIEQSEGAGTLVRRSIGGRQLRNFTPFLLLDHFSTTSLAGFPDHPHRGQGMTANLKLFFDQ